MARFLNIAFVASETKEAMAAREALVERYGNVAPETADAIVALGGDGLMLQTMHRHLNSRIPIYGMNRGSVGFLLNDYSEEGLIERLEAAETSIIHPLRMLTTDLDGATHQALAIDESLFRQTYQASKLRIIVDGKLRMGELICDGVLVSTPAARPIISPRMDRSFHQCAAAGAYTDLPISTTALARRATAQRCNRPDRSGRSRQAADKRGGRPYRVPQRGRGRGQGRDGRRHLHDVRSGPLSRRAHPV